MSRAHSSKSGRQGILLRHLRHICLIQFPVTPEIRVGPQLSYVPEYGAAGSLSFLKAPCFEAIVATPERPMSDSRRWNLEMCSNVPAKTTRQ